MMRTRRTRIETIAKAMQPTPQGGLVIKVNGEHYATTYNDSEGFLEINVSSERAAQALLNLSK